MDERTEKIATAARAAATTFSVMGGAPGWRWSGSVRGLHIPDGAEIALTIDSLARSIEEDDGSILFTRTGRLLVERVTGEASGESDSVRVSLELGEWDL